MVTKLNNIEWKIQKQIELVMCYSRFYPRDATSRNARYSCRSVCVSVSITTHKLEFCWNGDGRIELVFSMDDFIRPILHTRTVQKPKAYRENSGNPKIKILLSDHMSVIVFKCRVTRRYMRSFLYLFLFFPLLFLFCALDISCRLLTNVWAHVNLYPISYRILPPV